MYFGRPLYDFVTFTNNPNQRARFSLNRQKCIRSAALITPLIVRALRCEGMRKANALALATPPALAPTSDVEDLPRYTSARPLREHAFDFNV